MALRMERTRNMSTHRLFTQLPAIQLSALALVVGSFAACTMEAEPQCFVNCDAGSTGGDPTTELFPATKLPIDCRPAHTESYDEPNKELPECSGPIGSGVSLQFAG